MYVCIYYTLLCSTYVTTYFTGNLNVILIVNGLEFLAIYSAKLSFSYSLVYKVLSYIIYSDAFQENIITLMLYIEVYVWIAGFLLSVVHACIQTTAPLYVRT